MDEDRYLQAGQAALLAFELHANRVDRIGRPEILHIRWVAEHCSERSAVAGWLHDTVEDDLITLRELVEVHKLSPDDYGAVLVLTRPKDPGLTYRSYINRIADMLGPSGTIAREVKSWDLNHNRIRPCPDEMRDMRAPAGRYPRAQRSIRHAQKQRGEEITGLPDREIAAMTGIDPLAFPA